MPPLAGETLPRPAPARAFHFDWMTWLLLTILAAFIAAAFAPLPNAGFIDLDDNLYVFNNPNVLNGLSLHSIEWALTTRTGGRYMPTAWLSLQLDASIARMLHGGPEELPAGHLPDATEYHVTNIVLHMLAAWLLFLFLFRATGWRWASFAVTLLWAVHPLRVESVAWVTERKDEIAGVFGFLAFYLYVVAREKTPRAARWWFLASCAALVLSLWAKAMFVTEPVLLLVVDYWPLRRIRNAAELRRAIIEKWPMWVIVGLAALGTVYIGRNTTGALANSHLANAENAFLSYIRYIAMEVDFRALSPYYPFAGSPLPEVCAAVAILALVTLAVTWQRKRWPWLFAGWLWYLIAFLPMIGFIQSFTQAYADRFSYLPSVGLIAMPVFACFQWRRATGALLTATLALAIALSAFTFVQSQYWYDSITLFERARDVTPPNAVVEFALGNAYGRAGRLDDAVNAYREVLKLDPRHFWAHENLAGVYVAENRLDLALPEARRAVELRPECDAQKYYGDVLFLDGRFSDAAAQYQAALALQPGDAELTEKLRDAREKAAELP